MCCDNSGADRGFWKGGKFISLIDGECPTYGEETVEGVATDICNYSHVFCDECGSAPCDQSC